MHPSIPQVPKIDLEVEKIAQVHGRNSNALLPVLQALNASRGGLNSETILAVARWFQLPAQHVEGVVSFYNLLSKTPTSRKTIRVCDGIVCWLNGATECRKQLAEDIADDKNWSVQRTSCLGLCDKAPAALVDFKQAGHLKPESISKLVSDSSRESISYDEPRPGEQRMLLSRVSKINPNSINEAVQKGAYRGLKSALECSPESVIDDIEKSGLRGRGGAGFSTGRKWRMLAETDQKKRYVVCNADESEPLMFKDRVLLESDPHAVIEGIIIAAYAVSAQEGFIYIRGEYEPQAKLLEHAIAQAIESGWLGDQICGSNFSFHLHVHRGAGAYICGEETALLESLEGQRGEPRIRPPYPIQSGYNGMPTLVNNVETLATCAHILSRGLDSYLAIGNSDCPGTRLFTLLGHIQNTGLIEVPFGMTLQQMIDQPGGGMHDGSVFKFALTGGAAGTIIGTDHLDIPFDYSSQQHGITMGSGGILICDETVSVVALVRELMWFFEQESCGKCTPCRIGTTEVRKTLDRLLSGQGRKQDMGHLRQLAKSLKMTSFCGLGKSAADPLISAMNNFLSDFEMLLEN